MPWLRAPDAMAASERARGRPALVALAMMLLWAPPAGCSTADDDTGAANSLFGPSVAGSAGSVPLGAGAMGAAGSLATSGAAAGEPIAGNAGGIGGMGNSGGTGGMGGAGGTGAVPDAGSTPTRDAGAPGSRDAGRRDAGQAIDAASTADAGDATRDAAEATDAGCPAAGHVTYSLQKVAAPTPQEQAAYDLIMPAMDKALSYYNCYTDITKADTVTYNPSVQTADGNVNGSIRFGSTDSMNYITAMHEIAHTVGIGSSAFGAMVVNGIFMGEQATAQLRAITGNPDDQVHADSQHFWPYGLNYTSEVMSEQDLIDHCKMVVAIRKDLGL